MQKSICSAPPSITARCLFIVLSVLSVQSAYAACEVISDEVANGQVVNGGVSDKKQVAGMSSGDNSQAVCSVFQWRIKEKANKWEAGKGETSKNGATDNKASEKKTITAVRVNPKHVTLHWQDASNQPYTRLSPLQSALASAGKTVLVLMNAGIYSANQQPAGLHIEQGQQLKSLNTQSGKGNFHLMPNGVFLINEKNQPSITTTAAYQRYHASGSIRLATQSGPMLVIDGKVNAQFIRNSQSLYMRNAVCITSAQQLYFVATQQPINLYDFATVLRQNDCDNALYLDGSISKLYIDGVNTLFHFHPFVGILAVTV